jgi:hypothetical protein
MAEGLRFVGSSVKITSSCISFAKRSCISLRSVRALREAQVCSGRGRAGLDAQNPD